MGDLAFLRTLDPTTQVVGGLNLKDALNEMSPAKIISILFSMGVAAVVFYVNFIQKKNLPVEDEYKDEAPAVDDSRKKSRKKAADTAAWFKAIDDSRKKEEKQDADRAAWLKARKDNPKTEAKAQANFLLKIDDLNNAKPDTDIKNLQDKLNNLKHEETGITKELSSKLPPQLSNIITSYNADNQINIRILELNLEIRKLSNMMCKRRMLMKLSNKYNIPLPDNVDNSLPQYRSMDSMREILLSRRQLFEYRYFEKNYDSRKVPDPRDVKFLATIGYPPNDVESTDGGYYPRSYTSVTWMTVCMSIIVILLICYVLLLIRPNIGLDDCTTSYMTGKSLYDESNYYPLIKRYRKYHN
jgi:hypothetical protein